ncbi:copper amine oxidase-like protein [Salsuginibacillus halophilus]|uniref:Copper amine oxidase-like protein n=1 Tax=Salsuginibacillus halophilus TaxID=517424 RepID=A0A2P8HQJ1_9BACI|nr:phosphodiester glycosidase family protein [Salsuginibacillus halophilus]PSL48487.1 copper amine oxidase-like protein [Salsuginibacillus halophilus]
MKKAGLLCGLATVVLSLMVSETSYAEHSEPVYGYMDHEANRSLVPLRFVSETFGADVRWENDTRTAVVQHEGTRVDLPVDGREAVVNGETRALETSPAITNNRTYIPLRFMNDMLGYTTTWDGDRYIANVVHNDDTVEVTIDLGRSTQAGHGAIAGVQTSYRMIDLTNRHLDVDVGLAHGRVGATAPLAHIAAAGGADYAVNGTFFDAYTANTDPYGMIQTDGELAHIGRGKTAIGFTPTNEILMDVLSPEVEGYVAGGERWDETWYATWMNREAAESGSESILYTRAFGSEVTHNTGTHIVVENDIVREVTSETTAIPADGFVLYLNGSAESQMAERFNVGEPAGYEINYEAETSSDERWHEAETILGAGPRLVRDGVIDVGTTAEEFHDPAVTQRSASRSAIGVTEDRRLIVLTASGATMEQLARAMQSLGAEQAMNLDGGASSGLYEGGSYIAPPGRELSNALLFRMN